MLTKTQETELATLRGRIRPYMSGKRLLHTYAVEEEIGVLSRIYCPDDEFHLRIAGLLHDITKELKLPEHLAICHKFLIEYTDEEKLSPKIFHAKTAAGIIKEDFPEYSGILALESIRWHTTGRRGMTLQDCLLYLADWIEATRSFDACRELRRFFYDRLKNANTREEKEDLLLDTMIKSFDVTINLLIDEGQIINPNTIDARNYFIAQKSVAQMKGT